MTKPVLATVLHHLRSAAETIYESRLTDLQLLERYLSCRDETAFAVLVRRHGRLVLSACRRVLTEEADVEDAFQATFLVLLRKASLVRWQESLGNWLFGVAHRLAVQARANALRRRCRESAASRERQRPENDSPDLSWREALALLHTELDRLPDKYRLPLLLCYLDGKSREEAAQALKCSTGSIKGRLERGRVMLRERLTRRGVALSGALLAALVDAPRAESVPPALLRGTLDAAKTGIYRSSLTNLLKGTMPALWLGKTRLAFGVLLMVSLLAMGGSRLAPSSTAPEPPVAVPAEHRQPETARAQTERKDEIVYNGRVLGPGDKPIEGAKVYFFFVTLQEEAIPVRATTDTHGRFAFALTPKDIPLSADAQHGDARKMGHLVVKADGYTFSWGYAALHKKDGVFHVAADDVPLTGRIIDLEGKPLAGLHVKAWSVAAPQKGDLTPFVKALQSRETFYNALFRHASNRLDCPLNWHARTPLLPATTTDANGRFRLHGFAKEQLIEVRIEGPTVETQNVFIMNRPASREGGVLQSTPRNKDPIFGPSERVVVLENGFDYPLPPGQTVVGTVRDADTNRPIPRAIAESYVLAGTNLAQNTIYHTVADEQGRYRFTGLPRGKGNRIRIRPPVDLPYVPVLKDVPAMKLFAEAKVDAVLNRGVWVDVTVRDKATGQPVQGGVHYVTLPKDSGQPFLDNEFYGAYNDNMPIRNDGTFRFAAAHRRAVVALRVDRDKYPIPREAATIQLPGLPACNFQAFAEINPKPGDPPVEVNFVLDAGRAVKGTLVDPKGQPVSGAVAAGLDIDDWEWEAQTRLFNTADFTVIGLHPDRPRLVCFVHEKKKLAGCVVVRGDEKTPIAVKLQPWAEVSGRLLDDKGKPIPNARLWFTEIPIRKPGQPMALDVGLAVVARYAGQPIRDPLTDDQGRFHIDGLIPGMKYNLALMEPSGVIRFDQIKWPGLVFSKLILKAGETKELGDVKLQPFPKRQPPAGASTSPSRADRTPKIDPPQQTKGESVTVTGCVLDPDGEPARGATVYVNPSPDLIYPDKGPVVSTTTGKDGRYTLVIPRSKLIVPQLNLPRSTIKIVATAKGCGPDWRDVPTGDLGKEVPLRLVKDDVPIQGRILSLEGKPLAGVRVNLHDIEAFPKDDLSRALRAERNGTQVRNVTEPRWLRLSNAYPAPSATTDADGRFRLDGIGRERIARLHVEGPRIHYSSLEVMTRKGESVRGPNRQNPIYAATFEYLAKPARLIRGTVREKGTGKPVSGIRITSHESTASTLTDAQGRFELPGCAKGERYGVLAFPIQHQPYFFTSVSVQDREGLGPLTADLEMVRGIPFEGKLLDGETGKPALGHISYYPLAPNPNVKDNLGGGAAWTIGPYSEASVSADGSFHCIALPGPGFIGVQARKRKRYMSACVDPTTIGALHNKEILAIPFAGGSVTATTQEQFQGILLINPTKDTKSITETIHLAVAPEIKGTLLDPEGKPVAGTRVRGLEESYTWGALATDIFSITGVNPERPRKVTFLHSTRRLIGTVEVKGTETKPMTVRMQPWAAVSGRLVDGEGRPIRNAVLRANAFLPENGRTDKDGRFHLEGLIPGRSYNLTYEKDKPFMAGTLLDGFVGKPGENRDLGDVRGKPLRQE